MLAFALMTVMTTMAVPQGTWTVDANSSRQVREVRARPVGGIDRPRDIGCVGWVYCEKKRESEDPRA